MRYFALVFLLFSTSCAVKSQKTAETFSGLRSEFLHRINLIRTSGCNCGKSYMPPVPPLSWNKILEIAALEHAKDMAKNRYFSHNSLSGKTVKQRIEDNGYKASGMRLYYVGENIAMGQRSVEQVMQSWIKSEGHCKNMMSKNFKEIGVAQNKLYWVQDFGMRISL